MLNLHFQVNIAVMRLQYPTPDEGLTTEASRIRLGSMTLEEEKAGSGVRLVPLSPLPIRLFSHQDIEH